MSDIRCCSVTGCDRSPVARGWCSSHYYRWKRSGDPEGGRAAPGTLVAWLNAHAGHVGSDCLIWPFARNESGYGLVRFEGRHTTASRAMCKVAHGEPAHEYMEAAHSCGRGADGCVHPEHLRWDTPEGNSADRIPHGTTNRGERNGQAKLSAQQVQAIRALPKGASVKAAAEQYSVSVAQVKRIRCSTTWAWLGEAGC